MNRRVFLTLAGGLGLSLLMSSRLWGHGVREEHVIESVHKTQAQWRKILTPQQFEVLRESATERAFSSPLNNEHRPGIFACAGCGLELFDAATKFDSGTGWPSFYAPVQGHIATQVDYALIWPRTEYHCVQCGGHHGHVFDDGPEPTGQRYCNNGVALVFLPA